MLTSVIMVSYQTGPVLFDSIASVLGQEADLELYLVDNGNPFDVVERFRTLESQDRRFHLLTGHGNIGFGRGCNKGARAAAGSQLLFLNPDSLLSQGSIAALLRYDENMSAPYIIGARLKDSDGTDQRGCRRALLTPKTAFIEAFHLYKFYPNERLNLHEAPIPLKLTNMPAISGAFMFMRRSDFWRIDGFDERYFLHVEDLDLCLRFRRAGGEIYFAPDIVVTHLGATSRVTKAFLERHKAAGFIRYFDQNFSSEYPKPFLWALYAAIRARAALKIGLGYLKNPYPAGDEGGVSKEVL